MGGCKRLYFRPYRSLCKPDATSADAGYWSRTQVADERVTGIKLHIAMARRKHKERLGEATGPQPKRATPRETVRHKLRTAAGRLIYEMRKAIVESVGGFGTREKLPTHTHHKLTNNPALASKVRRLTATRDRRAG